MSELETLDTLRPDHEQKMTGFIDEINSDPRGSFRELNLVVTAFDYQLYLMNRLDQDANNLKDVGETEASDASKDISRHFDQFKGSIAGTKLEGRLSVIQKGRKQILRLAQKHGGRWIGKAITDNTTEYIDKYYFV